MNLLPNHSGAVYPSGMSGGAAVPRTPEPGEFLPADYFRRARREEIFPGGGAFEADLGCGDGSFLIEMARRHPERRFLGVERLLGRVRKVCRKAQREGMLDTVRVLRLEARYAVEWLLPPASVTRMHLLFPDPWPKARHHRRRLVQQDFLQGIETVMVPGGEFLFKTDHAGYHGWAIEELKRFGRFEIVDWPEDAFPYPETDFERQWRAKGREVFRLRAVANRQNG